MNLTEALAHSNNVFFEELGRRMGFDTVSKYGRLLGLGELAGYNLTDEHPGSFPTQAPAYGGVARMSSFGEGIQMTPLQLVAWAAAFANGGTLYYLQYPHTAEEVQDFQPKVKRDLNIANVLPEVREGMLAAVLYGTGRLSYDAGGDETPLGKTGTCDDHTNPSRIGWFVTYADEAHPKIALAVLLRGNTRAVKGPMAAEVAGRIYRQAARAELFCRSGENHDSAADRLWQVRQNFDYPHIKKIDQRQLKEKCAFASRGGITACASGGVRDFDVNAENGFTEMTKIIETMIAELQAKLVFAPGVKAAVTFITSREFRAFVQFRNVDFGMDFERDHENSPRTREVARNVPPFAA